MGRDVGSIGINLGEIRNTRSDSVAHPPTR